jgi:predicted RNA-binding Zn ribbon-like protein
MGNDLRREFNWIAGRPWLNFVGTRADRFGDDPFERLWDTDRLAEWLHHETGTARDLAVSESDLERARELREHLRALSDAVLDEVPPPRAAVTAVNRALEAYVPPRALVKDEKLRRSAPDSVRAALGSLALEALHMLAAEETAQLQRCAAPDCRGLFLDPTGRRRWCPTGRCGVKLRVRAHRERARASETPN